MASGDDQETKVVFRLRKPVEESKSKQIDCQENTLTLIDPQKQDNCHVFHVDNIFDQQSTQQDVFEECVVPILEYILTGKAGTFIAYGQTGSGKTHTVFGHPAKKIDGMDQVRDLGKVQASSKYYQQENLEVTEIPNGQTFVKDCVSTAIYSTAQIQKITDQGFALRRTIETPSDRISNRIHTIMYFSIIMKNQGDTQPRAIGHLYFADLAGSEKQQNATEQINITKTFGTLAKIIYGLGSGGYTPYRDSKLTSVLTNALQGDSKICFLCTLHPIEECYQENLMTLQFAERCKGDLTQPKGTYNESSSKAYERKIRKLQEEIEALNTRISNMEKGYEKKLLKLQQLLNLDVDIETLLNAPQNSKEKQLVRNQRDALKKVDDVIKRNKELEQKLDENQNVFQEISNIEQINQEKHVREIIEYREQIERLKLQIQTIKKQAEYNIETQMKSKTDQMRRMMAHSQILLNKKEQLIKQLPASMRPQEPSKPVEEFFKQQGEKETEEEFQKDSKFQEKNHQRAEKLIDSKHQQLMEQKDKELNDLVEQLKKFRTKKKAQMNRHRNEIVQLWDIYQQQVKVIDKIRNGVYNQNLKPVYIPPDVPSYPSKEAFPVLYKTLEKYPKAEKKKPSIMTKKQPTQKQLEFTQKESSIKSQQMLQSQKSAQSTLNKEQQQTQPSQQQTTQKFDLFMNVDSMSEQKLQEYGLWLRQELINKNAEIQKQMSSRSNQQENKHMYIRHLEEERDRYKNLLQVELKSRNDMKGTIESQQRMLQRGFFGSNLDASRPSTSSQSKRTRPSSRHF